MKVSEFNGIYVHNVNSNKQKEELKERIKKLEKQYDIMVKGRFVFHNAPGGELKFCHKLFKGHSIKHITLVDGEECELPLPIVKQLEKTKHTVKANFRNEAIHMNTKRQGNMYIPPSNPYTTTRLSFIPSTEQMIEEGYSKQKQSG